MSMRRFLLTCALVLFAALAANPAEADPVDDILAGFASSKYDEIEKTIGALAASGDASAPAILGALDAGALQVASDKKLYIKGDDGSLKEARSGADATGEMPPGLKPVKVNNRVPARDRSGHGTIDPPVP